LPGGSLAIDIPPPHTLHQRQPMPVCNCGLASNIEILPPHTLDAANLFTKTIRNNPTSASDQVVSTRMGYRSQ
ncbi:hypothetical protein PIB30_089008, partial [Stylosanthes scabra]|nr:hypothetical protein [Stylosanthes scabra]